MIEREMTCQELVELVTDYLEGEMTAEEHADFEAHLDDCPYCTTYLEQLRQTIRLTGRLSEETLPAEITATLLHQFRAWTR